MHRAGIRGMTGRPRWRGTRPDLIATDLVDRQFARSVTTETDPMWLSTPQSRGHNCGRSRPRVQRPIAIRRGVAPRSAAADRTQRRSASSVMQDPQHVVPIQDISLHIAPPRHV